MTEQTFRQEVNGWNDTMWTEIRARFGDDINDQLRKEADRRWEQRRQGS